MGTIGEVLRDALIKNNAASFAGRGGQEVAGFQYEDIIDGIDWNRVFLQAMGEHSRQHPLAERDTCGPCIKAVLLRKEE